MKLHAIQGRRLTSPVAKRGSDAFDLYQLLLHLDADGSLRAALVDAPSALRQAVRAATQAVLIDAAARTRGWLSSVFDQTTPITAEQLRYLAQPVVDVLV